MRLFLGPFLRALPILSCTEHSKRVGSIKCRWCYYKDGAEPWEYSWLGAIWVVNYPFSPAQQHIPRELAVLANHMDTIPSTHPHIAPRCYPSVDGLSHTRMGGTGVFSRPFSRVDGELPIPKEMVTEIFGSIMKPLNCESRFPWNG